MAFRSVLSWPNPALKKKSEIVSSFDDELTSLARDLYDTLNVVTGVGIAAPQIGVRKRMVLIDMAQCESENPTPTEGFPDSLLIMVNPKLELSGPKHTWFEACLSVPDSKGRVERSQLVKATYQTMSGEEKEVELDWPAAGVFQHECDHLDGILYIDRMNRMSRDMLTKKITKKRKRMAAARKLVHEQERAELDRIEGITASKPTRSKPLKKRKKRPAKKNGVNKRRRKKR